MVEEMAGNFHKLKLKLDEILGNDGCEAEEGQGSKLENEMDAEGRSRTDMSIRKLPDRT